MNWLERRALEHADPTNLAVHIVASVFSIYGLRTHRWRWIAAAVVKAFLSYLNVWINK